MNNIEENLDEDDEELGEEDYGFIIGPDGELKTLMFPENLMGDPPNSIKRILKIFKIENLHHLEPRTLH